MIERVLGSNTATANCFKSESSVTKVWSLGSQHQDLNGLENSTGIAGSGLNKHSLEMKIQVNVFALVARWGSEFKTGPYKVLLIFPLMRLFIIPFLDKALER